MSIQPFGPLMPVNPYILNISSRSIAYLSDGIYLFNKSIEYPHKNYGKHYGVVIKGRQFLQHFGVYDGRPIVIHKTDSGIYVDWIETYDWNFVIQVPSWGIPDALQRMKESLEAPTNYDLFSDNCEHFARYITEGNKRSTQIQNVILGAAAAGIGWFLLSNLGNGDKRNGKNRIR